AHGRTAQGAGPAGRLLRGAALSGGGGLAGGEALRAGAGEIHGGAGMRTAPDCVPCILRQTLAAVRCATPDAATHGRILQLTLGALLGVDLRQPPPAVSQVIQRLLRRETGVLDP